jgi:uncharacterized protein YkwD
MSKFRHFCWVVLAAGLAVGGVLSIVQWQVSAQGSGQADPIYRQYLPFVPAVNCVPGPFIPPDDLQRDLAVEEEINEIRVQYGLSPFFKSQKITQAALRHSNDMADNNFFNHTGSGGTRAGNRLDEACYNWQAFGEIIAAGYGSPAGVVEAWMDSPGHKGIILNPGLADFGAGYVYNASSKYKHYWTVDFGLLAGDRLVSSGGIHECSYHLEDDTGEIWVNLYTSQSCDLLGDDIGVKIFQP